MAGSLRNPGFYDLLQGEVIEEQEDGEGQKALLLKLSDLQSMHSADQRAVLLGIMF